ncbi:hypothetical protein ASC84_00570 [Acinetobacter sp. Root1280]|uniref:AAA family ATPase n=1 Tax=Acinetobacter sp. Root1280 TaxID=1736444 RepID=UPI000700055E|nr:AAA family ATPase [Acinetobacter sp. Root1280]KQX03231.1 hypothetical protein ASC84_00570 [Acinetobacter sp. Root1280]
MSQNYISKFQAENFRQFSKISMKFNDKFNFITGPNGCGKSSILVGIHHCLDYSWQSSRLNQDSSFYIKVFKNDRFYYLGLGKNTFQNTNSYRRISLYTYNLPSVEGETSYTAYTPSNITPENKIFPLFIGTKRSIDYIEVDGIKREETNVESLRQQYSSRGIESNISDVKQWLINRYFIIGKDWAWEEKENWNLLLENLPKIAPFGSNFKFVKIERDLEPIFTLYNQECYLEELSAGFQAIFSIIGNIIEWIEKTNVEGAKNIQHAYGTVIIDELDLHLHPEWQFNIRDGLVALFPNLQFIVTTHSPHLLASAKAGEVIIMDRKTGVTEYFFGPSAKTYSGWSTDQILEDVMGVKSLVNKDYERLIADALEAYNKKDKQELRGLMESLATITHSDDTILQVLKMKMASLELNQ